MGEKGHRWMGRAVRRGVALGLALIAGWALYLTSDPAVAASLTDGTAWQVAVLKGQLYPLSGQTSGLTGRNRLLLWGSPYLHAAQEQTSDALPEPLPAPVPAPTTHPDDSDDQSEPDLQPQAEEDGIVEMTAQGKNEGQYLYGQGVYLYNRTEKKLDASILTSGHLDVSLDEGPQILIVHTHGSEAYSQSDGDTYTESDPYRTTDCTHNVVQVGEEMARVFRSHGFQVIHDPTLHDYPSYSGAYERSQAAVEQWLEEYPSLSLVLDVHRDALVGADGQVYKLISEEAGSKVAQIMLVVGTDGSGAKHPRWQDNLALAVHLQQELVRGYRSLARPIVLRSSRYNQHLLPGSLLVEVGGHGNTLSEAIEGARLWSDNVARTLLALKSS